MKRFPSKLPAAAVTAGLFMLSLSLLGQQAQGPANAGADAAANAAKVEKKSGAQKSRKAKARAPVKATDLIGTEVQSLENEKLGHVDDVAVVLNEGRIVQVVLAFGGLLGVEDKLTAVPPRILQFDARNKVIRLKVETDKFKTAPRFEAARWEEAVKSDHVAALYRHYAQKAPSTAGVPGSETVLRASKLIGAPVKNPQDEKVGKVDNLTLDLGQGRIVAVVIASGEFLGLSDELSAVPASILSYNSQQDTLVLDANKDALSKAPRFKSTEWPDMGDRAYVERIHAAFGRQPPASPKAGNTRKERRDRSGATLTPLDQGGSDEDIQTTAKIRQALVGREGLSTSARNVKIITVNGKVTLRGSVNTADEKKIIEDLAASATGQGQVDSHLEVK